MGKKNIKSILSENSINGYMYLVIGLLVSVYFVGVFINLVNTRTVSVIGNSMEPTYQSGDRVRVKVFLHDEDKRVEDKIKRGDIVLAEDPDSVDINVVKRVAGVPGDMIEYVDGNLFINGEFETSPDKNMTKKQADELYNKHKKYGKEPIRMDKVSENNPIKVNKLTTVQPVYLENGMFWLVSDNLDIDTVDSRSFGPIYKNLVLGKIRKTTVFNIFEY